MLDMSIENDEDSFNTSGIQPLTPVARNGGKERRRRPLFQPVAISASGWDDDDFACNTVPLKECVTEQKYQTNSPSPRIHTIAPVTPLIGVAKLSYERDSVASPRRGDCGQLPTSRTLAQVFTCSNEGTDHLSPILHAGLHTPLFTSNTAIDDDSGFDSRSNSAIGGPSSPVLQGKMHSLKLNDLLGSSQGGIPETPKCNHCTKVHEHLLQSPDSYKANARRPDVGHTPKSNVSSKLLYGTPTLSQSPMSCVDVLNFGTPILQNRLVSSSSSPIDLQTSVFDSNTSASSVLETPKSQILNRSQPAPNDLKLKRALKVTNKGSNRSRLPTTSTASKLVGGSAWLSNSLDGDEEPRSSQSRYEHARPSEDQLEFRANFNPFTKRGNAATVAAEVMQRNSCHGGVKRNIDELNISITSDESCVASLDQRAAKRLAVSCMNTSRFHKEFQKISKIGNGQYGKVYECVNRMDGCTYAIKKSKHPVAGNNFMECAMNEVYAHAALRAHPNIVGYYSSWAENDHIYIQTEFCNGGCLSQAISDRRREGRPFNEKEMRYVMCHISAALKHIHANDLVHLDVKPDNILLHHDTMPYSCSSDCLTCETVVNDVSLEGVGREGVGRGLTYKLGDFGQVKSSHSTSVDEGDCRYLPMEVLQERLDELAKADIFSLAMTVFEMGSGEDLPKNGPLWQSYREHGLPPLARVSDEFNTLIKLMSSPVPSLRPTAAVICRQLMTSPITSLIASPMAQLLTSPASSRQSLRRLCDELREEREHNMQLTRELAELRRVKGRASINRSSRIIGAGCGRSHNLVIF